MLREVSYLSGSQMGAIPPTAEEIYSSKESYRQMVANLELMVNRYNKVLKTVLEVEYPLIEEQLRDIDLRLKEAEEILNWKMEGELALWLGESTYAWVSSASPMGPVSVTWFPAAVPGRARDSPAEPAQGR